MSDAGPDVFERNRKRLARIAYRMTASVADAEDIVQDTWLRWRATDQAKVQNPDAFLATTVARLCLDHMKSARHRRETYVGPFLPEPVTGDDPAHIADGEGEDRAILADELSIGLMLVLERLSPEERVAFVLRDAFDADYAEIANLLKTSEGASRQLVSRARSRIADERPRFQATPEEHRRICESFFGALAARDGDAMLKHFAEGVILVSDGGGKAAAALNPIRGADRVKRFFLGTMRKFYAAAALDFEQTTINGAPGLVVYDAGGPMMTMAVEVAEGLITGIYVMRNPDKLRRLRRDNTARPA